MTNIFSPLLTSLFFSLSFQFDVRHKLDFSEYLVVIFTFVAIECLGLDEGLMWGERDTLSSTTKPTLPNKNITSSLFRSSFLYSHCDVLICLHTRCTRRSITVFISLLPTVSSSSGIETVHGVAYCSRQCDDS